MKIFAAGIATETNTFSPLPTGLEDFDVTRSRVETVGTTKPTFDLDAVWGSAARASGAEFVLSLTAWANPAGLTVRSAYEALRDEMLADLKAALPVDVVLLMLHGAMLADGYEDCEQDIIERVRALVGPSAVVGVELDLHCHLSAAKIAAADVVVTYKEYPHDDIYDRAREVFELAVAAQRRDIRPTMALFDCRMLGFYPTSRQPLRAFVDEMKHAERKAGVLSISFGHGFPFADVPHGGAKVLVVTDDDQALAERVAEEFGMKAHAMRRLIGFESVTLSIEEAFAKALSSKAWPVVVADQSDNVGGGAPGDSTFALRWLLKHPPVDAAIAILYDPEVVGIAKKVGVGSTLSVRLGGKLCPQSGDPLDIVVTVTALRENHVHNFPQRSGTASLYALGDVAALRCGSIDVVVSSRRCQCFCPSIFSELNIDPRRKRLLIVKSIQHFYGAFSAIAGEVIYMSAPGAVPTDPRLIPFARLDSSKLYPWLESPFGAEAAK